MLNQIKDDTGQTPQALLNRPTICDADHFIVNCFYELNQWRADLEVAPKLNLTDIKSYIDLLGDLSSAEKFRFIKAIKALDTVYLEHVHKVK